MAEIWFRVLGSDGELLGEFPFMDEALRMKRSAGPGARIENFRRDGALERSHLDQEAQAAKRQRKFMRNRS